MKNSNLQERTQVNIFIGNSKIYMQAANVLLEKKSLSTATDPIYMLYFHAVELALKAFLRYRGATSSEMKNKWKHNLEKIYAEALRLGLNPNRSDILDFHNVIGLLHTGNREEAFRYFTLNSRCLPDLDWTRNVVGQLVSLVELRVGYILPTESRVAVKMDIVIKPLQSNL